MYTVILDIEISFLDRVFLGEKVTDLIWFASIIIVTLLLKRPLAILLTRFSSGLSAKFNYPSYKAVLRDKLSKPFERLLMTVLFYVAVGRLTNVLDHIVIHHMPGMKGGISIKLNDVVDHIFLFLFIIFLSQVIVRLLDFIYFLRMTVAHEEKNLSRLQLVPLVKEVSRMLVWTLSLFWILGSVFHLNVPALITGLGIGGVAIALAGKETVENFFAAFTLLSDKPFQIGDSIKTNDFEGVVERIGFRSTQLRHADGSACIIPNQKLVSQNVVNLTNRDTRGLKITANIRYGVTPEALQQITDGLKTALHDIPPIKKPVDITIEGFEKETLKLSISYHLPHPLPESYNFTTLVQDINMKVFTIITKHAELGMGN